MHFYALRLHGRISKVWIIWCRTGSKIIEILLTWYSWRCYLPMISSRLDLYQTFFHSEWASFLINSIVSCLHRLRLGTIRTQSVKSEVRNIIWSTRCIIDQVEVLQIWEIPRERFISVLHIYWNLIAFGSFVCVNLIWPTSYHCSPGFSGI